VLSPLDHITLLFDRGLSQPEGRWAHEAFGPCLPWLRKNGVLRPAALGTRVRCFECDDPGHLVDACWDRDAQNWRLLCPAAGECRPPDADVDVMWFDQDRFLELVAATFNVSDLKIIAVVPELLWYLGLAQLGQRSWSLIVSRNALDPRSQIEILRALKIGVGHGKGIVVCHEKPGFAEVAALDHTFGTFSELLELNSHGLHGRFASVRNLLGGKAATQDARTDRDISLALFYFGQQHGQTAPMHDHEADRILETWDQDRERPAKSTVKKHIADVHRAHRRSNRLGEFRIPNNRHLGTRVRNDQG
jgi:hypothetical protein